LSNFAPRLRSGRPERSRRPNFKLRKYSRAHAAPFSGLAEIWWGKTKTPPDPAGLLKVTLVSSSVTHNSTGLPDGSDDADGGGARETSNLRVAGERGDVNAGRN
jgi:hypothetical protein